jgi:hypothetical protein
MKKEIIVSENKILEMLNKIKSLNKILLRYGINSIEILNISTDIIISMGSLKPVRKFKYVLDIPDFQKLEEYSYKGFVEVSKGIEYVYSNEESYSLKGLPKRCDGCGIKRDRNIHHYFVRKKDNKLIVLGSTCVIPFFGIDSNLLESYSRILNTMRELQEESSFQSNSTTVLTVCSVAEYVYRYSGGWDKKLYEKYLYNLNNPNKEEKESFFETIFNKVEIVKNDDFIHQQWDKVKKFYKEVFKPQSDFEWNMVEVINGYELFDVIDKKKGLLAYAWVKYYLISSKLEEYKKKYKKSCKNSKYVGSLKERLELSVQCTYKKNILNDFGESLFLCFKDKRGNVFTSFYSGKDEKLWNLNIDDNIQIKGTIKDHKEFRGVPQTVLNRVKVIEEKGF